MEVGTQVHGGSSGSTSLPSNTDEARQIYALSQPPQKIACGFYHSAAISHKDGRAEAWSWGRNQNNVLGLCGVKDKKDGAEGPADTQSRLEPTQVTANTLSSDVYEVACGTNHTVFLKKRADEPGGVIFASGIGNQGRLGVAGALGSEEEEDIRELDLWFSERRPLQTRFPWASGTRALRIVCGADHTLCLATDRRVYAWGLNSHGQCGTDVNAAQHRRPTPVKLPKECLISHMAAGAQHSLVVDMGTLWTWGNGRNGRLGHGDTQSSNAPLKVGSIQDKVVFVAGGEAHSGAVDEHGKAFTWGAGSYGRLGHTDVTDLHMPKLVYAFEGMGRHGHSRAIRIKAIAMGGFHTLFLEDDMARGMPRLFGCGSGAAVGLLTEQDDKSIASPTHIGGLGSGARIVQIAAGMFHSLALLKDGELITWGVGAHGRLGTGHEHTSFQPTHVKLHAETMKGFERTAGSLLQSSEEYKSSHLSLEDGKNNAYEVAEMSSGSMHTFARTHGGFIFGWGCNSSGQLGFGSAGTDGSTYFWTPKQMSIPNRKIKQVACGQEFTLAVTLNEELWAWGRGYDGQLGLGDLRDQATPCLIPTLEGVQSAAAGEMHSAAIVRAKLGVASLYTWGGSDSGILGLGQYITSGPQTYPMLVDFNSQTNPDSEPVNRAANISPLVAICGPNSTAVLCSSQSGTDAGMSLWTFGNGWYGRLGHGNTFSQFVPKQVQLRNVSFKQASCGADHTCAVSTHGELWAWGRAARLGESDHVLAPKRFTRIDSKPIFRMVVCSEQHTLVVTEKGELVAWGDNSSGQLGLGANAPELVANPSFVKIDPVESVVSGGGFVVAKLDNAELYAWGNQSCGRLGLADKKQDKTVWEPSMVVAAWDTAEAMNSAAKKQAAATAVGRSPSKQAIEDKQKEREDAAEKRKKTDKTQHVISFVMLQTLLKQEDPRHYGNAVKKYAEDLETQLKTLWKDIRNFRSAEQEITKLETQLGESFKRNLRWFPSISSPETRSKNVDPRMPTCRPVYNKLLWVLQHQPTYLATLSQWVKGEEADVFLGIIGSIFQETDIGLVRQLQECLLMQMATKEAETVGLAMDKFMDRHKSVAFKAISQASLLQDSVKYLIHPILGGDDSLLAEVQNATASMSSGFTMSYTDFRDSLGAEAKNRDEQELKTMYAANLDIFRNFMANEFMKVIRGLALPKRVRASLCHVYQATQRWKHRIAPSFLADVPQELHLCEPILRVFCFGILIPLLSEAPKYATPAYFCSKRACEVIRSDPFIGSNLQTIADFLEQMLCNTIDPKDKTLQFTAMSVREQMLQFMLQMCGENVDLYPYLLVQGFRANLSRRDPTVVMSQADLMKLSNLLKTYSSRLRLKEHDAVDEYCKALPEWEKDAVYLADRNPTLCKFTLNARFMMDEDDIVVCEDSMVPLPAWVCNEKASRTFVQISDDDTSGGDSGQFLEGLFRRLQPLEAKSFSALRDECIALKAKLTADINSEDLDLQLVNDLDKAVRVIEELIIVSAQPSELMELVVERVRQRQKQFKRLQTIDRQLRTAQQKRDSFAVALEEAKTQLKQAISVSLDLRLPKKLEKEMKSHNKIPHFVSINKKMEENSQFKAKEMAELGCSYVPMATYSVSKLKKMKVVVDIHPPYTAMQKMMDITIRRLDGDSAELVASVSQGSRQNIVKRMTLDKSKMHELKNAKQSDQSEIGNPGEAPFLTCLSSNFMSLIVKLEKGTD
eukprot:gb/GFBE01053129.1/.p1 GENE.gb/GFBE01053129.1/~~gb/GFBE01053129.1/.p1  ORF type:complete len:1725 (+),score=342.08 gb/GFBE01053129.1/:1-5175(+)